MSNARNLADLISGNYAIAGEVADGSITALKLATDSVTTVKLAATSVTEAKIGTGAVSAAKLADTLDLSLKTLTLPAGAAVPSGSIVSFGGASAPSGWLLCYGQAISRTTYAALFAAIGVTHGAGDGSTTFAIPDLRGRVPGGKDDMGGTAASRLTTAGSGVDGATLGAAGGAQTHTLTAAQMPAHTHTASAVVSGDGTKGLVNDGGVMQSQTLTTSSAGSGSSHNNTQPTIVLNYIIKT